MDTLESLRASLKGLSKRVSLLEDATAAHDDLLSGLTKAVVLLGKRTKPQVGADVGDFVLFGPQSRLRPMPSGISNDDFCEATRDAITLAESIEDEEARNLRLRRQNAILEIRRLAADRAERKQLLVKKAGGGVSRVSTPSASTFGGIA